MLNRLNQDILLFKITLLLLSGLILGASLLSGQPQETHKDLKYELSVSAQLVPIFAVDAAGNPVYDLKKNEIILKVDGKPSKIIFFERFRLDSSKQNINPVQKKVPASTPKSPERLNFIIIDTLISNKNTMEPSRAIVMQLVAKASPGDAFVILESNQLSGFTHVVGPTKDSKEIKAGLKKLKKRYMRRRVSLTKGLPKAENATSSGEAGLFILMNDLDAHRAVKEREQYQNDILRFADSLKQLKYAMRTTSLPKTVYLLSAGQMESKIADNAITYLRFLEDAAKAINYGGAMFYVVNPLTQKKRGKGNQLKFMSDAVGGQFISGTGINDVVSQVKQNTSAYYEMAFNPQKGSGHKNSLKLVCTRNGVHLTTINYSEQPRPYSMMKEIEKKLFVLNIINGGSWSRMIAPVQRGIYKDLGQESSGKKGTQLKYIEVKIPNEIRNRKLDLYLVDVDPTTQKAAMAMVQKTVSDKEKLQVKMKHNRKQFFVIIDPQTTTCIYNQVYH
jgi:VWFA-related protein